MKPEATLADLHRSPDGTLAPSRDPGHDRVSRIGFLHIRTRPPRSWNITRVMIQQAAAVPAILARCSLLGWMAGGLYWLAAGVLPLSS